MRVRIEMEVNIDGYLTDAQLLERLPADIHEALSDAYIYNKIYSITKVKNETL